MHEKNRQLTVQLAVLLKNCVVHRDKNAQTSQKIPTQQHFRC